MINNLFLLATILFLPFHDFHVTHTTLHYNSDVKSIEITIKVALEDFERLLEEEYSNKLGVEVKEEGEISQKIIEDYFANHLKISTNKKEYKYQWVGKEVSNNLHDIYLYFEIPNYHKSQESITIENTLFLEAYADQVNIILVEFEDENYNLTFTKDNDKQIIFLLKN
jgi:hypothetical protein